MDTVTMVIQHMHYKLNQLKILAIEKWVSYMQMCSGLERNFKSSRDYRLENFNLKFVESLLWKYKLVECVLIGSWNYICRFH